MNTFITDTWDQSLDSFQPSEKDVYYFEEYVKAYEDPLKVAKCIICTEENNVMLMPFLQMSYDDFYDFETPYGYGGPISNTQDKEWNCKALQSILETFRNNGFLCGFVRFHPLLKNYQFNTRCFAPIFNRKTVFIDTSVSNDEIWKKQIISKNRNMIRKAINHGLTFIADYSFEYLKDFISIYNATMHRLEADSFYFFDQEYYVKLCNALRNKFFLGVVKKENEVISAAIFMHNSYYGQYHLAGSKREYSNLGANNFLLWNAALELKSLGVKLFHLGGGYNSHSDNSLYKFKKAFSNNEAEFYIGKWIFNQQKYDILKSEWEAKYPEKKDKYGNFLLFYRY